jgi:hypothetical protein
MHFILRILKQETLSSFLTQFSEMAALPQTKLSSKRGKSLNLQTIGDIFLLPLIRVQVAVSVMVLLQVAVSVMVLQQVVLIASVVEAMGISIKFQLLGLLQKVGMGKVSLLMIHPAIDLFRGKLP